MKVNILFEDDYFLVIEKPAGLLVYNPSRENREKTLVDILSPKINFKNPDERSGIVHRLDRETSGLLVVAKNEEAERKLKAIFKERKIEKEYLALVWGEVKPQKGEIRIPLGRGSKDRLRVVPKEQGRESVTRYEVLDFFAESGMSFLKVDLLTGRTHQIRVHFSSIGHPLVGDEKYSRKKSGPGRQFLHAARLSFNHPITGKKMYFESDLPDELKNYLANLK